MLRKLIIDELQSIDVEVTELNMMRVYLSVESEVENNLNPACEKFKLKFGDSGRRIHEEISKLSSFYDFLIFITPSLVGDAKSLNDKLNKICRSNSEKAAMVCILNEYDEYASSERYTIDDIYDNFYSFINSHFSGLYKSLTVDESKDLLSDFLYFRLDYFPVKHQSSKKFSKENAAIHSITSLMANDRISGSSISKLIYCKYKSNEEYQNCIRQLEISDISKLDKVMRGIYQWNPLSILTLLRSYENYENDYNLEQTLVYSRLLPLLKEKVSSDLNDVTVFNPSIFFIRKILNDDSIAGINKYRFVLNDEDARFLKRAYEQKYNVIPKSNKADFISVKDWDRYKERYINQRYDLVIYFGNHDGVNEQKKWLSDNIPVFDKNTKMALLLSANYAGNVIDPVKELLDIKNSVELSQIELMPQGIVNASDPKRKILVMSDGVDRKGLISVIKFGLHTDENRLQYAKKNQSINVKIEDILNDKVSILKLYNSIMLERKGEKEKRRRKKEYYYSPEISFSYNVFTEKNGYRACIYYISEREKEDGAVTAKTKKGNKGKRFIKDKRTEIFRRFDSDDRLNNEFLEWVENEYPFKAGNSDMSIRSIISADIKKQIKNKTVSSISLKTFWFIFPELQDKLGKLYESLTVAAMSDLGFLYLSQLNMEQCYFYLNEVADTSNKASVDILKAIVLSLDFAAENGLIQDNKLKVEFSQTEKYERNRIAEVRNALVKKTFTEKEINKIINYIENKEYDDWSYVSALIRLLLPIDVRSVAALRFCDIVRINDYPDLYKLKLSRYVDDDNKVVPFKKIEQYRYLPFPRVLQEKISDRIKCLEEKTGLMTSEIEDMFVFCDECGNPSTLGKIPISPSRIRDIGKDVVSNIGIPSNIIEVMNKGELTELDTSSFRGDIFVSNFEYYAMNYFGFTMDEVAFLKGNKSYSTFARHYNDYNNDSSICALNVKLYRYVAKLYGTEIENTLEIDYMNQKNVVLSVPEELKSAKTPFDIEVKVSSFDGTINIDAENNYGMDISVSKVKR